MTSLRPLAVACTLLLLPAGGLAPALAQSTDAPAAEAPQAGGEDESGPKTPRFVSLGSSEINVRTGPGSQYPIAWKYVRAGLPVEIVAEFEYWRKIRDQDGSVGWVHKSLLSGKRFVVVMGAARVAFDEADETSRPIVRLEAGVVARLNRCRGDWCRVDIEGYRGWLKRAWLWGIYPDETVN
jgi:SH3-like domain-containing protein